MLVKKIHILSECLGQKSLILELGQKGARDFYFKIIILHGPVGLLCGHIG